MKTIPNTHSSYSPTHLYAAPRTPSRGEAAAMNTVAMNRLRAVSGHLQPREPSNFAARAGDHSKDSSCPRPKPPQAPSTNQPHDSLSHARIGRCDLIDELIERDLTPRLREVPKSNL